MELNQQKKNPCPYTVYVLVGTEITGKSSLEKLLRIQS